MEFWCLLAAIGSVTLALDSRKASAFVFTGVFLGLAVGFHPLALYFLPGLLWLSTTGGLRASDAIGFQRKPAIFFTLGFGLVILTIVLWFLADWPLRGLQFLAQVRATVRTSLAQNAMQLFAGLKYNFRFQPIFPFIMLAAMGIHLWHILRRRRPDMPEKAVSIGLMLFVAGLIGFLLQQPTIHLNYYPALRAGRITPHAGALPDFTPRPGAYAKGSPLRSSSCIPAQPVWRALRTRPEPFCDNSPSWLTRRQSMLFSPRN